MIDLKLILGLWDELKIEGGELKALIIFARVSAIDDHTFVIEIKDKGIRHFEMLLKVMKGFAIRGQ
jgi:hypothetical protein